MQIRYSSAPSDIIGLDTAALRGRFLAEDLFADGEARFIYSHDDRVVLGGVVPTEPIALPNPPELRADFFLQRREVGIINVGQDAVVLVDGERFEVPSKGCLYVGRGVADVVMHAPGRFYLFSAPAHASYPTAMLRPGEGTALALGDQLTSNERTINQYIHPGGIQSCQLMMGLTELKPGSMWNTMPAHLHDRRMEAYLYFELADDARVMHFMGAPDQTRHLVVANEQAVISPPWSIHSGVGTSSYAFIWAMAGETQQFTDMDPVPVTAMA